MLHSCGPDGSGLARSLPKAKRVELLCPGLALVVSISEIHAPEARETACSKWSKERRKRALQPANECTGHVQAPGKMIEFSDSGDSGQCPFLLKEGTTRLKGCRFISRLG